jgi:glycosyltransferase involved in cell wall biosynthesis
MTEVPGRGPRMSVVIPNYNHGHLIADALGAISRQTMLPSEVVVVDDGSTDDSVTRLQSLAADMPWLRIHRHSENRGVNAACNSGLDLVSGDFVLFSASDDRLDAETVERAFAARRRFRCRELCFPIRPK